MPQQLLLFLGIEGVLCPTTIGSSPVLLTPDQLDMAIAQAYPYSIPVIRALDAAEWIEPMWVSELGVAAKGWNDWAKTQRWAIAYPLPDPQIQNAIATFPQYQADQVCLSVCWCSRRWRHRIIWIQTSFSAIAQQWSSDDERVQLIQVPSSYISSVHAAAPASEQVLDNSLAIAPDALAPLPEWIQPALS